MISDDRRLRVLHALLRRVEGDEVALVTDAIRQRRRVLENEQGEAEHLTSFGVSPVGTDESAKEPAA